MIASVATQIAEQFGRSNDLHLSLEDQPLKIFDQKLSRIVEEVTNNAFKFFAAGTPVSLTAAREEQTFVLLISNSGRGMTAEQISNLVQRHSLFLGWAPAEDFTQ